VHPLLTKILDPPLVPAGFSIYLAVHVADFKGFCSETPHLSGARGLKNQVVGEIGDKATIRQSVRLRGRKQHLVPVIGIFNKAIV